VADHECSAALSFAETPLEEISAKVAELVGRGWVFDEERKGDPWLVLVSKRFVDAVPHDCESELREVMGNYWVDLDGTALAYEEGSR
jgi:hypothetical protein